MFEILAAIAIGLFVAFLLFVVPALITNRSTAGDGKKIDE